MESHGFWDPKKGSKIDPEILKQVRMIKSKSILNLLWLINQYFFNLIFQVDIGINRFEISVIKKNMYYTFL